MKDVLRKIKEAEQSAEKRLSSAQTESSKVVADARRVKPPHLFQALLKTRLQETQATLDAARSKANKEAEGVLKEGASTIKDIESDAASRKEKAVKSLLDAVTSQ